MAKATRAHTAQIGNAKRAGRKKGGMNKSTIAMREEIEKTGCNPVMAMLRCATKLEEQDKLPEAGNLYGRVAEYYAPRLSNIKIENTGDIGGLTLQVVTRIEKD